MEKNRTIRKKHGMCHISGVSCEYKNSVFCRLFKVELALRSKSLFICNHTYGSEYEGKP